MSNTNTNLQTQTSNALHNAIMEAGGKDHPPMLAPGSYSQKLKTVSYHKLYDILKQHRNEVNEIRAERLARTANPLALVAQQQPVYHPQNHPNNCTQNSLTRSQQAATRNRGKAIVNSPQLTYNQEPEMVAEDDALANQNNTLRMNRGSGYDNQRVVNVDRARENVAKECQKLKREKDVAYHKEKMLLCKQEEAGFQLNAEQAHWRDDSDDEPGDHELKAHYMYMAQIQEVTPDAADTSGPIFDAELLQKVQNNDDKYNVFAIKNKHPEQPESVNYTYLEEQDDTNITIDSLDMCNNGDTVDQDDDDLSKEGDLFASLIGKLKCEIDDNKNRNKFLKTSNKALVDKLKCETEDFKTKNKILESSNNHFKEANNELSKTNQLMFKDLKKFQAELDRYHDVNYASKVEIDYAKAKGDLMSYKMEYEKSQQAATRNRGKAIVNSPQLTYNQEPEMVAEDDALANQNNTLRMNRGSGYDNQRVVNVDRARENVAKECQKLKREKDVAYHKEKMLLCKQEEAGFQLNAEQAHWRDDSDDEPGDHELKAHYMYMAQIQEVTPDAADTSGPIFDAELLQKVQNNDDKYNVFAIKNKHPEQPESVNYTYLEEQDDTNITIDSLDMCNNGDTVDQDDDDLSKEAPAPSLTPAPVKAVKPNCVTVLTRTKIVSLPAETFIETTSKSSWTLPSNTVTNPQEDLKGITTRSGVAYQGPTIPTPSKVVKQGTEPVVTPVSASMPNLKPSIPYPSRRDNERRRDQANEQIKKFYEIFKDMSFEISFTDALTLMPKFASTLKALIGNKEKISEMARTPMNEHCLAVILNKLPKKLGDPGKFLIPCEFPGMDECLALADLGASINLMPLSVWEGLLLLELTPTFMTLKLVDRLVSKPIGIAKDVSVKLTTRALIGVHKGELALRIGNEAITYNLDQTSRYSANYNQMTANKIDVIDMACEEDSDFLLFEEADAFLGLEDDLNSLEFNPFYYDSEGDILLLEAILNSKPLPPLPNHEQYMPSFKKELKGDNKLPVIIAKELGDEEKSALIKVLKSHKRAIAWKLFDIQEVEKLLDAGLIYPISDSSWVSPIHCVPKKGVFTIVENEENELIPTHLVTGWRVCIDYRKLNEATRKDHFPLPFMDQMLERLAGNEYYCFLDGFSMYFQIPIDPPDQEKTTFTAHTERLPIVACLSVCALHQTRFKGEMLAVVYAFENFWSYLIMNKSIMHTDHSALMHLFAKKDAKARLLQWVLLIQEFDFKVLDTKGAENLAADHLSRL
uniref:RNA-directed DNA polymerase n=1 Tax=Tanacetum cinerariifolium TaxID=118510 RepID=A0A6L2KE43_TANCI|nr:DNA-directed DNA polymerase [Tanacetum cinerariifolium]